MNILLYTSQFNIGREKQDLALVDELCARGHKVLHAAPTNKIPILDFPGFPDELQKDPDFIKRGTVWVDSFDQFYKVMKKCDLLLLLESKWACTAADLYRQSRNAIIQYKGISDMDFYDCEADLYCIPSQGFKNFLVSNRNMAEDKTIITGSLQYDPAVSENYLNDNRNAFCEKYGLDAKKKIALWLPDSPANHHEYYKHIYKNVCRKIIKSGYNLLIKGHPWDYIKRKTYTTYSATPDKHSWEVLAPGISVCEPHEFYKALHFCDVGITIVSSVCMELPLFKVPMIFVDRYEYFLSYTRPKLLSKIDLSLAESRETGWHIFDVHDNIIKVVEQGKPLPHMPYVNATYYKDPKLEFIGMDCKLEDLEEILINEKYIISDNNIFDEYVEKWCFKNDGKAYKRVANAVEEFIRDNPIRGNSTRSLKNRLSSMKTLVKLNLSKHFI